jgi:hypothetical protein
MLGKPLVAMSGGMNLPLIDSPPSPEINAASRPASSENTRHLKGETPAIWFGVAVVIGLSAWASSMVEIYFWYRIKARNQAWVQQVAAFSRFRDWIRQ